MKDPDVPSDTEPDADSAATTEPGSDTDPGSEIDTSDTEPQAIETAPNEDEEFFRWLPTMWLGYRRQKELVHRCSSEGGDFVAYASAGRPAPASAPLRAEATVQVAPSDPSRALARDGAPDDAQAAARDAPTVVLPRRRRIPRALLVGTSVAALVTAAIELGLGMHRPVTSEAARAAWSASAPALEKGTALGASADSPQPAASPFPAPREDIRVTSPAHAARGPAAERTLAAPIPKRARPKTDAVRAASWERGISGDAPAPSPVPAKDLYFEAQ